jgi:hypothetical protein
MKKRIKGKLVYLVFVVWMIVLASGNSDWFSGGDELFNLDEDINMSYFLNLSSFVNNTDSEDLVYEFQGNSIDSSLYGVQLPGYFSWIDLNEDDGNLSFFSFTDDETGKYNISIDVERNDTTSFGAKLFYVTINATNDVPNWTSISDNYTYPSMDPPITYYINLTDEEEHYPLNFSVNFVNNCTHAPWTGRGDGENCTLFGVVNNSNNSAYLNYTSLPTDVGMYWAELVITEAGHSCPHEYCENSTYNVAKVVRKNITIEVLAQLEVNVSDCDGRVFNESYLENCTISIRTRDDSDTINVNSVADFATYDLASPDNTSWFYPLTQTSSSSFFKEINISVNASHSLAGNWTINLSVYDLNTSELNISLFNITVNWSGNSVPTLSNFQNNYTSSIKKDFTLLFNVTDLDYLIEDKNFYDETMSIDIEVVNISSGLLVNDFYSLSALSINNEVGFHNLTFNAPSGREGNYTVTVNATDASGVVSSKEFNMTIVSNNHPYWNQTEHLYNFSVNSTIITTANNISLLNLSRSYANDSDVEDTISFFNDSNAPPSFSLSSDGIVNFFPWKRDVGYWEFDVTASDNLGLENSSSWRINVSNVNSIPEIDDASFSINGTASLDVEVNQSDFTEISFFLYDDDLLISDSQIQQNGAYNESFELDVSYGNTSVIYENITLDFYIDTSATSNNQTKFVANFTSSANNIGNYTFSLNITDQGSESDIVEFNISVLAVNSYPIMTDIDNVSTSILNESFSIQVNASDDEDTVRDGTLLNFTVENLTVGAPSLGINLTGGLIEFNFSRNETYGGVWDYTVTANDSDSATVSKNFTLTVFASTNVTSPISAYVYNLTENQTVLFNFTIDYMVNNTNLTYELYMDNITSSWLNETAGTKQLNYTNLSLVESGGFIWNSSDNILRVNYTPSFYDETYGLYKNLTVIVYNYNYSSLNSTIYYNLNVSHVNYDLVSIGSVLSESDYSPIEVNLSDYFQDVDSFDLYYDQVVNFTFNWSDNSWLNIVDYSFDDWLLTFVSSSYDTYNLSITAEEFDSNNNSLKNVTSNWFNITFNEPPVVVVPSPDSGGGAGSGDGGSSGGTRIVVEHYALKVITPSDIVLSPEDYIELNFSVLNNGNVDLQGIVLSSFIELAGVENYDIEMSFSDSYIETLGIGEEKNYTLRVSVDTSAVGEYKITIYGNVTSPKFYDWGEFFIKVESLDEGQLSQLLIFTEKLISENPECLELREVYVEAKAAFDEGNFAEATRIAQDVIGACEEAIVANEQIRFFDDKVMVSLIYALVITVGLFGSGLVYYFYRRIKFKKSIDKDYI